MAVTPSHSAHSHGGQISPSAGHPHVQSAPSLWAQMCATVVEFISSARTLFGFFKAKPDVHPCLQVPPSQPAIADQTLVTVKSLVSEWPRFSQGKTPGQFKAQLDQLNEQDQIFRNNADGEAPGAVSAWLVKKCGPRFAAFLTEVDRTVCARVAASPASGSSIAPVTLGEVTSAVLVERLAERNAAGISGLENLFGDAEVRDLMTHLYCRGKSLSEDATLSERCAHAAVIGGVFQNALGRIVSEHFHSDPASAVRAGKILTKLIVIALGCVPRKPGSKVSIPADVSKSRETLVPLIKQLYLPEVTGQQTSLARSDEPVEADFRNSSVASSD